MTIEGDTRVNFCSSCDKVGNYQFYMKGSWLDYERCNKLIKINNIWVCDDVVCKRKAKLKVFW